MILAQGVLQIFCTQGSICGKCLSLKKGNKSVNIHRILWKVNLTGHLHHVPRLYARYHDPSWSGSPDILFTWLLYYTICQRRKRGIIQPIKNLVNKISAEQLELGSWYLPYWLCPMWLTFGKYLAELCPFSDFAFLYSKQTFEQNIWRTTWAKITISGIQFGYMINFSKNLMIICLNYSPFQTWAFNPYRTLWTK